jgi:hypothetical protein
VSLSDRRIAAIATGQLGAFTRVQANDVGLSDRQLRSRVQSGILIRTGPNSFRYAGAPTSLISELADMVMSIGGGLVQRADGGGTARLRPTHCVARSTSSFHDAGTSPAPTCRCIEPT